MGFGIAFLGYCFLALQPLGLTVVAVPLLAYGFFLASRLERAFLNAAVSALFMLPRGLFLLADIFLSFIGSDVDLPARFPTLDLCSYLLFSAAWLFMIVWHCMAVRRIAAANQHKGLLRTANRQLYISALCIVFDASTVLFRQVIDDARILLLGYLCFYAALLTNLFFTHTCLVLITSERRYADDLQEVAEQDRQAAARRAQNLERGRYAGKRRKK